MWLKGEKERNSILTIFLQKVLLEVGKSVNTKLVPQCLFICTIVCLCLFSRNGSKSFEDTSHVSKEEIATSDGIVTL